MKKNAFEWIVFSLSSVLVITLLAYLAYQAWTSSDSPPALQVLLGKAEPRAGEFAIPVTVFNRGQVTAEAVRVQVVMTGQDGSQEQAGFDIQYLPQQASRRGSVSFRSDPRAAKQLLGRAVGYQIP